MTILPPPLLITPEVSISGGSGVTEGGDASFTITANPTPSADLSVSVVVSQSGDLGVTSGSRTVIVPTGGSATLTVVTTDDGTDEADGSVTATVDSGEGYTVSATAGAASVAVLDDEVPVVSISGGSGVTEGGSASFTVSASPAPYDALVVSVTVTTSGDFGVVTGLRTVTIPVAGSATLTVVTTDDGTDEADGSVTATVDSGEGYTVSATAGAASVAVSDDDDAPQQPQQVVIPVVSISGGSGVTEGGDASFTITANPTPSADLSVSVVVSQSGDLGVTSGSRTVIVPTGGSATLTVVTTDDGTDEADGSVTATVDSGEGYTVSATAGAASVAVLDDEVPVVSISGGSGVTEGGSASFTVSASPAPYDALVVSVTVTTSGDFGVVTGLRTVTIPVAGSATLTVGTTDDSTDEADGSVTATVVGGSGYTVGQVSSQTVQVQDDDEAPPQPSYTVDSQVVAAVQVLAAQTHHGPAHVNRWQRALVGLGVLDAAGVSGGAMTAAEARQMANKYSSPVWDQVVTELTALEAAQSPQQLQQVVIPVVSISGGSGVTEGGSASFTVSASPAPYDALVVSVTVTTSGDFGVVTGLRTVTIPVAGSATLTVGTTDDSTDEADGSVTATVVGGSGYTVGQVSSQTVQVQDDDEAPQQPQQVVIPVVSISGGSGVAEGGDASFIVTASPVPVADLVVSVTVTTSGDFGVVTGLRTVTIPVAGSATLIIGTTDDSTDEADGSVTATLVDGSEYDLGTSSATVAVADDDVPVVSVSGGSGVAEGGDASFIVTASPVPVADLVVSVTVTTSGDFGVVTGLRTVTIPVAGSATLIIGTTDDGNDEADGSVTVTVNSGNGYTVSSSEGAATVSVADNDAASTPETAVTISIEDASAEESAADLVFRVILSEASDQDITVAWTTRSSYSDNRARGGQGYGYDFWHARGEIRIRAGETSKTGVVWLNQDSRDEPDEVFTVEIYFPVGATIGRGEATMTIIDDD